MADRCKSVHQDSRDVRCTLPRGHRGYHAHITDDGDCVGAWMYNDDQHPQAWQFTGLLDSRLWSLVLAQEP